MVYELRDNWWNKTVEFCMIWLKMPGWITNRKTVSKISLEEIKFWSRRGKYYKKSYKIYWDL